jgi:DtxR family transcriptional regulator, Mn-dependent transcriptional regulator
MYNPLIALVIGALVVAAGALLFWPEKGLFNRWQRSRRVTQRVLSEDALKHIHEAQLQGQRPTLQSIAGALQISPNRAADLVADLDQRGLLTIVGDEPRLTPEGREAALHVIRAHRLWERHLAEDTGFAEAEWHQLAEQHEHELSPSEADALAARLGNPTRDPHGDPIPTPDGKLNEQRGQPLAALAINAAARIIHIEDEPEAVYAQLVAEGLYPGQWVRLLEVTPQRVRFWANGNEHVLAPIFAANIAVVPGAVEPEVEVSNDEPLHHLKLNESGTVTGLSPRCRGVERRRMLDLGIVPGTIVRAEVASPSGDPIAYRVRGALIALRREQSELVRIVRGTTHGLASNEVQA